MMKQRASQRLARPFRAITFFAATLLLIELLDEFVYGAREAAWPLIRTDLRLSYVEIGLALALPTLIGNLIEPVLGILGDMGRRRSLILGGGVVFTLSLLLVAGSRSFALFLAASIVMYPASGAFVSLSQATLMDLDPARHEQNMARWTLAGSVGVVVGPLSVGAMVALGPSWRGLFASLAVFSLVVLIVAWRRPFPAEHTDGSASTLREGAANAWRALRQREVVRWLILLECSDLLLDVFLGYLALYMTDVAHARPIEAGLAVAVWTVLGLLGNVVLIPLLTRLSGLRYLRASAALALLLYPAFLLVPGIEPKMLLLGVLGFCLTGWYPVLQGRLYSAMPGQSGTVMAFGTLFGVVRALIPLTLAAVATRFTLGAALWLLLVGPISLLVGLPRSGAEPEERT